MYNYQYFRDVETLEDVKKLYKKLCFEYHPDVSKHANASEIMKAINNEYEIAFNQYKNTHKNKDNETYTTTKDNTETYDQYQDIINRLIHMQGITIELIGTWLWVTGNTKPYKEEIKTMGFKFSGQKLAWFIHPEGYKKRNKNRYSMDTIRNMFGSEEIKTKSEKQAVLN